MINFNPTLEDIYKTTKKNLTIIFSGPNNCGKTILLKKLFPIMSDSALIFECNNFTNSDQIVCKINNRSESYTYYDFMINETMTQMKPQKQKKLN